jgi:hypothetical protein
MATVATRREKTLLCEKEQNYYEPRIPLTPTGLLMEAISPIHALGPTCIESLGSDLLPLRQLLAQQFFDVAHFFSQQIQLAR